MKYNPKINDEMVKLPGFADIHPLQPADTVQAVLVYKLAEEYLCSIIEWMPWIFSLRQAPMESYRA